MLNHKQHLRVHFQRRPSLQLHHRRINASLHETLLNQFPNQHHRRLIRLQEPQILPRRRSRLRALIRQPIRLIPAINKTLPRHPSLLKQIHCKNPLPKVTQPADHMYP